MTYSFIYWFLMLVWVLSGAWYGRAIDPAGRWAYGGWSIILFILFIVIGLKLFGFPIKG